MKSIKFYALETAYMTAYLFPLPKVVLKQKLLAPILQVVFPILSATPPPGEEDPEDEENAEGDGDSESPKHFAAQVTLH